MTKKTLYDKLWESHLVDDNGNNSLIYIDRQLIHEVTSPQAFEGLYMRGIAVRHPKNHLAVADHNIPTEVNERIAGLESMKDKISQLQIKTLEENCQKFGIKYFKETSKQQGIVHIVGPEQGFTHPGMTIVCGDSHTATHGAFGALAFGIGTSEVEHVLATQTLIQKRSKNMLVKVEGDLNSGITAKDLILHIISKIGTAGGTGYVIEYVGDCIKKMSMESRMTICNMSIEAGAKAGLIAPDEVTFEYMKGKNMAPKADEFSKAVQYWKGFISDEGAKYDKEVVIDATIIKPYVTWGTSPEDALPVDEVIPALDSFSEQKRKSVVRSLEYMGLKTGQRIDEIKVDKVFIGSCTNGRIEDFREVAKIVKDKKIAPNIDLAMIVPGSGLVKNQAEEEGLDKIFIKAGFEWRMPGCSMCLAMNSDKLKDKERCASTSNRNFEGRQGRGGRTHLMSPAMAALAAINGKISNITTINQL